MKKCSKRIILGSGSPRRRELLAGLDVDFTVDTANTFEESVPDGARPEDVPLLMSEGKSHGFHRPLEDDELLITADTVVIVDSRVLGKPHGREQAIEMLRELSGREHEVVSAVTFRSTAKELSVKDTTKVFVSPLSDEEI
ncbi:MAG: Maf family protein, partial [Bacteroidales bacterium]|nr:Maf family protein [Bacteroidales bacterium]